MKPTRQFVICFIAFLSLSLSSITCYASTPIEIPVKSPDTSNPNGQTRAPFSIPLTASYSSDALSFNFLYPVGSATITIANEYTGAVYLITVDTFTQPDLYIPIDIWDGGSYHISIQYGCNTITAEFEL